MKNDQFLYRKKLKELNEKLDDKLINITVNKISNNLYNEINPEIQKSIDIFNTYRSVISSCKTISDLTDDKCKKIIAHEKSISELINFINNLYKYDSSIEVQNDLFPIIEEMNELQFLASKMSDSKQKIILKISINGIIKKIIDIVSLAKNEIIADFEYYIKNELDQLNELKKIHKELIENSLDDTTNKDNINLALFDYKEMNNLAKSNGYTESRQHGSHKIFSNGTNSIVIPQHTLGKGLSIKIQKQIDFYNCKINENNTDIYD